MNFFSRFWIQQKDHFLGKGKIELLEKIKESGSILKAAKAMKMSYKAAWDNTDSINRFSTKPAVICNHNGSILTDEGERMIAVFKQLDITMRELEAYFQNCKDWDILEKRIILLRELLESLGKKE